MTFVVLTLVLLAVAGIYLVLVRRSTSRLRHGDREWRERWRALEPARRRTILQTMRQGQPVHDPEDAELALRAISQIDYVRTAMRPIDLFLTPALIVVAIAGIFVGLPVLAVIAGVGLAVSAVLHLLSSRRRRRLQRSADATRQLMQL